MNSVGGLPTPAIKLLMFTCVMNGIMEHGLAAQISSKPVKLLIGQLLWIAIQPEKTVLQRVYRVQVCDLQMLNTQKQMVASNTNILDDKTKQHEKNISTAISNFQHNRN